jgi:MFS family permease
VQLVVQIPALLWGGAIADHLDRKKVMFGAQMGTFGVLLTLGIMDGAGVLQPWHVYTAIGITAASQMVSNPAAAALAPATVPQRYLMTAITTTTATQNIGMIIGPLLFAVVVNVSGLTAAFYVAAAVTLPSALLPQMIRVAGRAAETTAASTISRVKDGFVYVVRHPILPGLFLLDTGITVVSFYREILPALVRGLFQGGATATGILGAANSAGAVGGSMVALFFAGYQAKGMLVLYASLAYGIFLFGFSAFEMLWIGVIFIALIGGADSVTVAVRHTTVQLTTPDNMRGRAHSFMVLSAITPEQKLLIEEAPVFFVASVAPDLSAGPNGGGAVNVSPKGGIKLHVVGENRVAYLDFGGSGNETARHSQAGGPCTVMVMSTTADDTGIIRLYGQAKVYGLDEYEHREVFDGAPEPREIGLAQRQVVEVTVESTQTSCGYGVPIMEFRAQRTKSEHGRRYKEGQGSRAKG